MKLLVVVISLFCFIISASEILSTKSQYKVLIDNDGGADDAMAVFLALLYEKYFDGPKVVGLTTTHGNVVEEQCSLNNQKFLKIAQRQEVPIYRGSKHSLVHHITPPGEYFGVDGLGDSNETFTDLMPTQEEFAVNKLIDYSKTYKGELVVIAIGPLTNIALAIKMDPGFLNRLKQLYIAGGHIHNERHSTPEFNANMDVEAFKIVLDNSTPDLVTVLPYSQTEICLEISKEWREGVFGAIDNEVVKAMNVFERICLNQSVYWYALDPAMVACVLKEDLVDQIKYAKQNIITCGEERGKSTTVFTEKADANVRLLFSIDQEGYKNYLIDVFSSHSPTRASHEPNGS